MIYQSKMVEVTDGDTLVLNVDMGLRWLMGFRAEATRCKVRLSGCNSPEKNTVEGKAAKAWTTQWLTGRSLLLKVDINKFEEPETEKYGRVFGDVLDSITGESLVAELVKAGHAKPWDGTGPKPV